MAEDDDRQAGMVPSDPVVHRRHVGDHLRRAVIPGEGAERGVRRFCGPVAAMDVRIDVEWARTMDGRSGWARAIRSGTAATSAISFAAPSSLAKVPSGVSGAFVAPWPRW